MKVELEQFETVEVIFTGNIDIYHEAMLDIVKNTEDIVKLVKGKIYTCIGYMRNHNPETGEYENILILDGYQHLQCKMYKHLLLSFTNMTLANEQFAIDNSLFPFRINDFTFLNGETISLSRLKQIFD